MRNSSLSIVKSFDSSSSKPRSQYQELFETLGLVKNQSTRSMPRSIRDLKSPPKVLQEIPLPVGRKDTQALIKWLDSMLSQVTSTSTDIESILESALSIYQVCFNEVIRQVSVHCKERGELISRIWNAYINLLERALRISKSSQQSQVQLFKQEKETIKAATSVEIFKLKEELLEKNGFIFSYNKQIRDKDEEIGRLNQSKQRLERRFDLILNQYEEVKTQIISLKEENRILKAKLLNTETEFVVNKYGVIEAQHKRLKIKRKTKENLEKIVNKDPIIRARKTIEHIDKDKLNEEIKKYEHEIDEIFEQTDFRDASTEMTVQTSDKQEMTELEMTAGECLGEAKIFNDTTSMVIELIDLSFQSMLSSGENNMKILKRQSTQKQRELEPLLKDQNNIEKINVFLEKMKENIHALARFSPPLLPTNNHSKIINQKSLDQVSDLKRLKTIRKKLWSHINDTRHKKSIDVPALLIQKIRNTPQHKLKAVFIKKILLKTITSLYENRTQKRSIDPESRKQELSSLCLEHLSNKYGPGKIAESKLIQIASSCIKYMHIKRISLFSRFLKLTEDELDLEDLDLYLDLNIYTKTTPSKETINQDYSDQFFISFDKGIELIRSPLLQKFSEPQKKYFKSWLESNKSLDMNYKFQTVDLDAFFEVIIEKNRMKKYDKINFLKSIYEAADLNEDGFLQIVEFNLLARHIAAIPISDAFSDEIFKEYAEDFTDENENSVQALSFENFSLLNATYQVFTMKSMQNFSKITNNQGAIWHIKQVAPHIDQILNEIEWRLRKKLNWNEYKEEYSLVLGVIKSKVLEQKNPESVWIALRLLQEESKQICIENALKEYLPGVRHLVITSGNIL